MTLSVVTLSGFDCIVDRAINNCGRMIVGLCQGQKTALRTFVITCDTAACSDRNTVCMKDLTFLYIRQHKLWNDTYIRIAMVMA